MKIETSRESHPVQSGGDIRLRTRRRWWRAAIYWGEAPGSHKGVWRTGGGYSGRLRGWNLRIGRLQRCVTVLVHTRRETP